jgi:hypothetical protein
MTFGASPTHRALEPLEHALGLEHADDVARDQAAHRVSDEANLGEPTIGGVPLAGLEQRLDLGRDALPALRNAVVRARPGHLARWVQEHILGGVALAQRLRDAVHVLRLAPEAVHEHDEVRGRRRSGEKRRRRRWW